MRKGTDSRDFYEMEESGLVYDMGLDIKGEERRKEHSGRFFFFFLHCLVLCACVFYFLSFFFLTFLLRFVQFLFVLFI